MKTIILSILLLAAVFSVAQARPDGAAEKPFAEGGQIRMELGPGDYDIVSGSSDRIQIEWATGTSSGGAGTSAEIEVTRIEGAYHYDRHHQSFSRYDQSAEVGGSRNSPERWRPADWGGQGQQGSGEHHRAHRRSNCVCGSVRRC